MDKQLREPRGGDLTLPGSVVAITCALGWGVLQVAGPATLGPEVQELGDFVERVLFVSGFVAAAVGFLTWPAVASVLVATAKVMWDRDCEFRDFLAGAGWCHLPLLLSSAVVFLVFLHHPPSLPADVRRLSWLADSATFCHGAALAWLVSSRFHLSIWKGAATVATPWLLYRLFGWLIHLLVVVRASNLAWGAGKYLLASTC